MASFKCAIMRYFLRCLFLFYAKKQMFLFIVSQKRNAKPSASTPFVGYKRRSSIDSKASAHGIWSVLKFCIVFSFLLWNFKTSQGSSVTIALLWRVWQRSNKVIVRWSGRICSIVHAIGLLQACFFTFTKIIFLGHFVAKRIPKR